MIYVDAPKTYVTCRWRYKTFSHMWTDGDIEELHAFAAMLGLKREWFQNRPSLPHYDVTPPKRVIAIRNGAVEMSTLEWMRKKRADKHAHQEATIP